MKTFSELRQELTEAQVPSLSSVNSITAPSPGEQVVGGKTIRPPQLSAPKPDVGWGNYKPPKVKPTTIGDVGKSVAKAAGRVVVKTAPALATGLAAGAVAKQGLNAFGPSTKGDKVTNNAKSGIEFKGDLPTMPKEFPKKLSEPQRKIPQQELGGMLRNDPQTLNRPQKTINVDISKKSPLPKEAPNKIMPKGKVSNEPMRKSSGGNPKVIPKGTAPKMSQNIAPKPILQQKPIQKSMPKAIPTRKSEADPNIGAGRVTARAFGNKSGITSTQNLYGGSKGQSFMKPTPQGRIKPAETQSQKDSRLAAQGFKKM